MPSALIKAPELPPDLIGVRVVRSLVFYIMICRSLFVLLYFFFWPLCYLFFFDIRILIIPLVSSSFPGPDMCTKHRKKTFQWSNLAFFRRLILYMVTIFQTETSLFVCLNFHLEMIFCTLGEIIPLCQLWPVWNVPSRFKCTILFLFIILLTTGHSVWQEYSFILLYISHIKFYNL